MPKAQKPNVVAVETEEQKKARATVEAIASNIENLARTVGELINGRIKKDTLVTLLSASSGLSKNICSRVLTAIASMDKDNLK